MLKLDVVLETFGIADFAAWPIVDSPGDYLCLSGQLTPLQVGTAPAAIAGYNASPADDDIDRLDGPGLLRHMTQADALIAPGGLRIRDTVTGVDVTPGCCCGLEDWRLWQGLLQGDAPWLGHDPEPVAEHVDGVIRLWPDRAGGSTPSAAAAITIPAAELPSLLATAQRHLSGFLALVAPWADGHAPAVTPRLIAALDEHLRINQPLGLR
jgi:hypothetical protein